jgi:hypothetical protein
MQSALFPTSSRGRRNCSLPQRKRDQHAKSRVKCARCDEKKRGNFSTLRNDAKFRDDGASERGRPRGALRYAAALEICTSSSKGFKFSVRAQFSLNGLINLSISMSSSPLLKA